MPIQFTTEDAPHRRLALWQESSATFRAARLQVDSAAPFPAQSRAQLGRRPARRFLGPSARLPHALADRAVEREFLLIALGQHGVGGVVQDGRETVIRPASSRSTIHASLRIAVHRRLHANHLPGASRDAAAADGRNGTSRRSPSAGPPVERLAYDFIFRLCQSADRLDQACRPPVRAGRRPARDGDERAARQDGRCRPRPIAPPALPAQGAYSHPPRRSLLSLTATAAALGISPRYVNSLFADTRPRSSACARRALEQCQARPRLAVLAQRHVSEIAFAWGFNDLSHFGRVFREHYGMSPRDFRHSRLPH